MPVTVRLISDAENRLWDSYVAQHPQGNVYQQSFWGKAISQSYGHRVHYLAATQTDIDMRTGIKQESIIGVLPLVHIKNYFFGNRLFSMPYADLGGLLADSPSAEQALLQEA